MMPPATKTMQNLKENWIEKYLVAFLTTILGGLVIHFQLYSNMLMSPDSLWFSGRYFSNDWELSLGRWLWLYIDKMGFGTVLPFWNTFVCLIIYGITNVILSKMYNINDKILQSILSLLIISSPYFSMSLQYYSFSIKHALGCLFAILSIYFIRTRHISIIRYLLSIISLALSLACYQCYLGIAAIVALILIIFDLMNKSFINLKYFFIYLCKYIIVFVGGIIQYYVILQLLLNSHDIMIASYKGVSDISLLSSLESLPYSILQSYKDFFEYFGGTIISRNAYGSRLCYFVFATMFFLSTIKLVLLEKELWKKIAYSVLILIVPVACNIVDLIATNADMYLLGIGGMLLIVPLLTPLMLQIFTNNKTLTRIIYVSILALTYTFILQDNVDSKVMLDNYKQASSLTNRMWQRVEEQTSYSNGMKVMIAGIPGMNPNYVLASDYINSANDYAQWGLFWTTWDGSTNCWRMLIKNELGINVNMCNQQEYKEIANTTAFWEMNEYPAQNSIGVINNVIVVKISNIDKIIFQ